MEETEGFVLISRSILEQARKKIFKSPELWLAAIRTEKRSKHEREAEMLLAKSLQVSTSNFYFNQNESKLCLNLNIYESHI